MSILKSLFATEKAYYAEKDQYSEDACAIGFQPERANRYAYFLGLEGVTEVRDQPSLPPWPPGCGLSAIGVDTFRWGARWAVGAERLPPLLERARPGVSGACPRCEVAGACVGWIPLYHRTPLWVWILGEPEKGLDAWSISTRVRRLPDGGVIAPGEPWNDLNALAPAQADHR